MDFFIVHFGTWLSNGVYSKLPFLLGVYSVFLVLGWFFPIERPYWQRFGYIVLPLMIIVFVRRIGIAEGFASIYLFSKKLFFITPSNNNFNYSFYCGALGYLLKRTPSQDIAAAIRSVSQGYSQLGPTIALKVFSQLKPSTAATNNYQDLLSKREIEVFKLIGSGKNNQEIAQELYLSEGTVKNYVTQILTKMEMRDRVQAALWAQKNLL